MYKADAVPSQYIDVGWGNDKDSDDVAMFGNLLANRRIADKPVVHFLCPDGVFHTVVAFDADVGGGAYLLWLRVNVSGDLKYASGKDAVRWQPPHPSKNSGPHRIFIVVFTQTAGESAFDEPIVAKFSRERRNGFDIRQFASQKHLHFIGANCCTVEYDASVDSVETQLRDSVELDASGRKIVAETLNGVRTEFGKKSDSSGPTV